MIPAALPLLALALAAWRTWHLAALDVVLARPRGWVVGARSTYGGPVVFTRPRLEEWLGCVYCSGFWVALAWYLGWLWEPRYALYAAAPLALSAAAALIQTATPD